MGLQSTPSFSSATSRIVILQLVTLMMLRTCVGTAYRNIPRRYSTRMASSSPWDFYKSIGSPKFVSAPMVDQSNLAWRLMVRQHGADLAFSQMMHARNFMTDKNYRAECIDWDDYTHRDGEEASERSRRLDHPLIVQLAGDDPDTLVAAGRFIHHDVAAIDLNLGCPQKIAKKGNYGAYLLQDKDRVLKCLSAMVKGLDCPVTAEIRVLSTEEETIKLCKDIEALGVSMLTVHGRTVEANKLFVGAANWDIIRKVKQSVSIPVIANGGISCREDALKCLELTGVDGVMSSEGLLENPKLFSEEGDRLFREDYVRAQLDTVREYLEILNAHRLPRPLFQVVRSHMFKMLYRFIDCPAHADLREQLASGDFQTMQNVLTQLYERMSKIDFDTKIAEERELISKTYWYFRHRTEKAATRILSTPRRWSTAVPPTAAQSTILSSDSGNSGDDVATKLSELKARLTKKREQLNASRDESLANQTQPSSFSKFIAKVDV